MGMTSVSRGSGPHSTGQGHRGGCGCQACETAAASASTSQAVRAPPPLTPSILTSAPEPHFHHEALRPRKVKPSQGHAHGAAGPGAPAAHPEPSWWPQPWPCPAPHPSGHFPARTFRQTQCRCHAHPSLPNPTSRAWPPPPHPSRTQIQTLKEELLAERRRVSVFPGGRGGFWAFSFRTRVWEYPSSSTRSDSRSR